MDRRQPCEQNRDQCLVSWPHDTRLSGDVQEHAQDQYDDDEGEGDQSDKGADYECVLGLTWGDGGCDEHAFVAPAADRTAQTQHAAANIQSQCMEDSQFVKKFESEFVHDEPKLDVHHDAESSTSVCQFGQRVTHAAFAPGAHIAVMASQTLDANGSVHGSTFCLRLDGVFMWMAVLKDTQSPCFAIVDEDVLDVMNFMGLAHLQGDAPRRIMHALRKVLEVTLMSEKWQLAQNLMQKALNQHNNY